MNLLNLVCNYMQVQIMSIGFHDGCFPSLSEEKIALIPWGSVEEWVVTCTQPEVVNVIKSDT